MDADCLSWLTNESCASSNADSNKHDFRSFDKVACNYLDDYAHGYSYAHIHAYVNADSYTHADGYAHANADSHPDVGSYDCAPAGV